MSSHVLAFSRLINLAFQPHRTCAFALNTGCSVTQHGDATQWRLSHREDASLCDHPNGMLCLLAACSGLPPLPLYHRAHGTCVAFVYERTNQSTGQRARPTFRIPRTMLSPASILPAYRISCQSMDCAFVPCTNRPVSVVGLYRASLHVESR